MDESSSSRPLREYSCLICRQRKVKCDRLDPCSNCVKAEAECSFIAPVRGKRKSKKPTHEGLHAKLRRYERMLEKHGERLHVPSEAASSDADTPSEPCVETPQDLPRGPTSLTVNVSALPNNSLWSSIGAQYTHPDQYDLDSPVEAMETSHETEETLLEWLEGGPTRGPRSTSLRQFYPDSAIFSQLRTIYTTQVDPMMKMLHLPSLFATLTPAVESPGSAGRSIEAAIFCFCLATMSTMAENQFSQVYGQTKDSLIYKQRRLARQSLTNARFMENPDLLTFQALCLYLLGIKGAQSYSTYHILCGTVLRLMIKAGLNKDGTSVGLPPFETELRRRLWWHMVQLDFRTSDLLGIRPSADLFGGDVKSPLNIEDGDIWPGMTQSPTERNGITSLVLFLVRCDIMDFLKSVAGSKVSETGWEALSNADVPIAGKDQKIAKLEDLLESKYLRYCDPCETLHVFASVVIRSVICRMKVLAHNPKHFAQNNTQLAEADRDIVFTNASKLLEYAALIRNNPDFHKFMWRTSATYIWDTILYALIAARHRKAGPEIERLWHCIGVLISHYPDAFSKSAAAVHAALSKWIPEVWDEYSQVAQAQGLPRPSPPDYIAEMREIRAATTITTRESASQDHLRDDNVDMTTALVKPMPEITYEFSDLDTFAADVNEWLQWEQLLAREDPFGNSFGQM